MNDVLIFLKTKKKHEIHMIKVLQKFQKYNLRVKKKLKFFK